MPELVQQVMFKEPRPTIDNKKIIDYVVDKLFKDFINWVKTSNELYEYHPEQQEVARKDLYKVIEDTWFENDGYYIARGFENSCMLNGIYSPDEDLVEILSNVEHLKYYGLKELEKTWMLENNLLPPFNIGDKVTTKAGRGRYKGIGEVTKNDEYGYSHVYFPDSGHVRTGPGTHAGIIKWEDLEVVKNEQ